MVYPIQVLVLTVYLSSLFNEITETQCKQRQTKQPWTTNMQYPTARQKLLFGVRLTTTFVQHIEQYLLKLTSLLFERVNFAIFFIVAAHVDVTFFLLIFYSHDFFFEVERFACK